MGMMLLVFVALLAVSQAAEPPVYPAFPAGQHYGAKEVDTIIQSAKSIPVKSKGGFLWMEEDNGHYQTRIEIRRNENNTFDFTFKPTGVPADLNIFSEKDDGHSEKSLRDQLQKISKENG